MDKQLLSSVKIAALVVIAAALVVIAIRLWQPAYVETDKGMYLDTHSGKFYQKHGDELGPVNESIEDRLKREYPDGRKY